MDYRSEVIVADQTSGTISNKYDALSRWSGQTCPASGGACPALGGAGPYEITVVNGAGGLPESLTSLGGTVSYSYDQGWRLTGIAAQPAGTFALNYNASNGLISGVSCSAISAAYTFDLLDRIQQMEWKSGTNVLRKFDYDYNTVGMITQKITTAYSLQSTALYEYDSLNRLISETSGTSTVNYAYDLSGNRTQVVENGQTINYTVGLGNRLMVWGVDGTNSLMQYDNAGNVTSIYYSSSNQVSLKWDSQYRITAVYTNSSLAESYTYDALDRRVSISDWATTNYLVYNGIHCVAEVGTSGSLVRSYTYGPGIDNILSMTVYGGTTQTYYYVKDHLGTVAAVVDGGGQVVESYQYDAWGNTSVFDGSGNPIAQSAIGNRYCWQGREISWKTGLYFFRARWYDPVTGRWLSNDPIGISGGLNQYVFCGDDPVNHSDAMGLAPFTNNSDKPILYKPEGEDFKPPKIAQPGETVNADGIYSPEGTANPAVIKIPDFSTAEVCKGGKLTVTPRRINNWLNELPRKLTPEDLSKEEFRNWPDPYTGRQWPYGKWPKP